MTRSFNETERKAIKQITEWREHPANMVRELFGAEPDPFQEEALEAYPHCPRLALKSCKGPGKTTTLSWIAWNFLLTRPHPNIGATSISSANLSDGLWKEMAKWQQKAPTLQQAFEITKTRIFNRQYPETWFMSARTWSQSADGEQLGKTLAGLHSDYILFLLDESGGMPEALLPTAEAALAGAIEAHVVQAGNPISLVGPLYRAAVIARHLWKVIEVTGDPDNPKRSPRIPIQYARDQIAQYGRENPWVLVNIFGEFPPSSLNSLIGPEEVRAAMNRVYREHDYGGASRVLGVDVARFGDDASVIAPRQGIQCFPFKKYRNLDSTQGAGQISRVWNDWSADACFIDNTGGYGSGWLDQLQALGKSAIGVQFAGEAHQKSRYYNKRAEMAFEGVEWIKRGGALPDIPELLAALTQTTYTFLGDRFLLEPKDEVKKKLGYSPDDFDAFILTFAEPVTPRAMNRAPMRMKIDYDPFAEPSLDRMVSASYDAGGYDPFR